MSSVRTFGLAFLLSIGAIAACSGYDGGGDVRLVPVEDAGTSPAVDGRAPSSSSSSSGDAGQDSGNPAQPKPPSVIAYYPLDGSGEDDSPSASLPLTIQSGSFGTGRAGEAISLLSPGYAATRPQSDAAFAFGTADFTIQAWFATSTIPVGFGTRQLLQSAGNGWVLYATQSSVVFLTNDPRGAISTSTTSTTAFRHVVVRRASGVVAIFVDGEMETTRDAVPSIAPEREFGIQRPPSPTGGVGRIDEIVIWSRALGEAEIEQQRTRGLNGQRPLLEE